MKKHEFIFDEPKTLELNRQLTAKINSLVDTDPAIRGISLGGYDGKLRIRVRFDNRTDKARIQQQLDEIFKGDA